MQPLYDALRDMLPNEKLEDYILKGIIQTAACLHAGRTRSRFVILDEAQNTTHSQMKMFLTRMGKSAKFMVTGDPVKSIYQEEPFQDLKRRCFLKDIEGIGIVYLDDKDIV
jgi:phosphate starvation-inducible PhoH-like protein